ncbi:GAF domain-containing protein [Nitrosopumilus sp.]|uniref:GAF domain-containing protein n=1 Tax=Nitrosopumilus sp. TaxID=2024843 RepID=UPI00292CB43F|nr:GAF domain-containing protein [Nitrosopumilus sp.]
MPDEIDNVILSQLGKNSRMSSQEISKILQGLDFTITDRAVRQRLQRLEKNNTIIGYTAILNPKIISEKVNRTVLLKFKISNNSERLLERLTEYVNESQFCTFSSRISGDFDWICHFIFDSVSQYDLETNNFLNKFADLISDYRTYESNLIKASPYTVYDDVSIKEKKVQVYNILNSIKKHDTLNERLQSIVESLVKYFDAKFARVWFVDSKKKFLVLKFSAGKYKDLKGEFSKVPIKSLKIGTIVTTKKPVVSNDVAHDHRIKYHDWTKKEKLKSFAGYPLLYKGNVVAVMAMFSQKRLSPSDFEVLGVFSEQISKELTGFFETQDFLSN